MPTLIALLAVATGLAACHDMPVRRRAIVIGLDGATFRVIRPLMEQGDLPNLSKLARQGVAGPLASEPPLLSPRVWNTIATGRTPEDHGITNWVWTDDHGITQLFLSEQRKVHALWNLVTEAGGTVGVVNWLTTFPPDRIHGVMVSDHAIPREIIGKRFILNLFGKNARSRLEDPEELTGDVIFPPERKAWLERMLASKEPSFREWNPFTNPETFPRWVRMQTLDDAFASDVQIARMALELQRDLDPDLLMVLFQGIDRVSHLLWGSIEPAEAYEKAPTFSEAERKASAEALYRYYAFSDHLVGLLLEQAGPDDLALVVSDHGFEAGVAGYGTSGGHESEGARYGILFARGRGIPAGSEPGPIGVADIEPTVAAWLGLDLAENLAGKPAPWVDASRSKHVATYETKPIERMPGRRSGVEDALIEKLRSLGYVEDEGGSPHP